MKSDSELQGLIGRCSRCGTCRAACPIFEVVPDEPASPRARVQLLAFMLEGRVGASRRLDQIYSDCLLCGACVRACPNAVPVDGLVLEARSRLAAERGLGVPQRLALRLLPALAALRRLAPGRGIPAPRARVAYFAGCANRIARGENVRNLAEVLEANQVEVLIPEQTCCGMPALAQGDRRGALELARLNVQGLAGARVDAIISDCGTCVGTLRRYGEWLGSPDARRVSALARDAYSFLAELGLRGNLGEVPSRVTYHDPCHLAGQLRVKDEPRELLRRVPGVELVEMAGADRCCGGAGSFMLTHHGLSGKVAEPKLAAITATGAEVVVTTCPSCQLQLSHRLGRSGVGTTHLLRVLARAYRRGGVTKRRAL